MVCLFVCLLVGSMNSYVVTLLMVAIIRIAVVCCLLSV